MQDGYQVIEPPSLTRLLGNRSQAAVAMAVLEYAIDRIRSQSPQLFDEVSLEVIPVTYYGTYPAIGIRYSEKDTRDLGPLVSDTVDEIVRCMSFQAFISFVEKSNSSWCDIWLKLAVVKD